MMNQKFWARLCLLVIPLAVAGCGNQPPGYSRAYGKVLYKGEPAAGAILFLHPEGKSETGEPVIPSATVEDDGSFEVESASNDGAPPGKYKLLVSWPTDEPAAEAPADPKTKKKKAAAGSKRRKNKLDPKTNDRFKGRYFDVNNPLTTVVIKAETTDLGSLDLKD